MGFTKGSVTFKRFIVQGTVMPDVDMLLDKLSSQAIGRGGVQLADGTHSGWITGEHICDVDFSRMKNALGDGLLFAIRIDTNKPPTDLVRSYQRQNEAAMLEASGREFLSKAERREAREQAVSRADLEARSGTFRRMRQVPAFWDLKRNEVYLASTGMAVIERFVTLFHSTFELLPIPVTAGVLAERWATDQARELGECTPARFVDPPDDAQVDESFGCATNGFLGTEWLTWLWFATQVESSQFMTTGKPVTVMFEKTVQMACAFGLTGTLALKADDVTRLPELKSAMAEGKLPVRAGIQIAANGDAFGLNLRGDLMQYSGVQLPPPEDVTNARGVTEERIEHLRSLIRACDDLYEAFLCDRFSAGWTARLKQMRLWISGDLGSLREAC